MDDQNEIKTVSQLLSELRRIHFLYVLQIVISLGIAAVVAILSFKTGKLNPAALMLLCIWPMLRQTTKLRRTLEAEIASRSK